MAPPAWTALAGDPGLVRAPTLGFILVRVWKCLSRRTRNTLFPIFSALPSGGTQKIVTSEGKVGLHPLVGMIQVSHWQCARHGCLAWTLMTSFLPWEQEEDKKVMTWDDAFSFLITKPKLNQSLFSGLPCFVMKLVVKLVKSACHLVALCIKTGSRACIKQGSTCSCRVLTAHSCP